MVQTKPTSTDSHSVVAVSAMLAEAFSASSVQGFVQAILQQIRQSLPASQRDPAWLGSMSLRLSQASRRVCLAGLFPESFENPEKLARKLGPQEAAQGLEQCIEAAAQHLDAHALGPITGDALRASMASLLAAVQGIATRCAVSEELAAVRMLEQDGAPPTLLFRLNGEMLWLNASLARLCQRRELQPMQFSADAQQLARDLAANSRPLGGDWEPGKSLTRRGERTDMSLRATLRRGPREASTTLVEVVVSEARRQTRLTPRELQVARMLVEHGGYQRVAQAMNLSLDSVRTYVRRVYRKLALNNQAQLRARLVYEGLLADSG